MTKNLASSTGFQYDLMKVAYFFGPPYKQTWLLAWVASSEHI